MCGVSSASMGTSARVIEVAIEPKTKTDRDALSAALNKLAKEDPSFRVKGNEETGSLHDQDRGRLRSHHREGRGRSTEGG